MMGFITDELREERLNTLAAAYDAAAARKQRLVNEFCDPGNLDDIANEVELRVRQDYLGPGRVTDVVLIHKLEAELHENAACQQALLERLQHDEPNVSRVSLQYAVPGGNKTSKITVTFSPALQ